MSVRNDTFRLASAKGEPQLTNVYGFAWSAWSVENTVSGLATIRAEIEYDDDTLRTLIVRPGAWYGSTAHKMRRVWFTSASPGTMLIESATDPEDRVVPATAPPTPIRLTEVWSSTPGANLLGQVARGVVPTWAKRLGIIYDPRAVNGAGTADFLVELAAGDADKPGFRGAGALSISVGTQLIAGPLFGDYTGTAPGASVIPGTNAPQYYGPLFFGAWNLSFLGGTVIPGGSFRVIATYEA